MRDGVSMSMRIGPVVVMSLAVTLAACTTTTTPAAQPSGPTTDVASPPPTASDVRLDGVVVFSAEGDIWSMRADGSRRRQLTTHPGDDLDPAWSPDGTRIAFRSHRDGDEEVYVMDADGAHERNLTRNPTSDYSPAWSPDGRLIAFASDRDGDPNEIYVMDADGSDPVRVTDNPGIDEYPTWSPDGTIVAFHCTMGGVSPTGVGDFEICTVRADGGGLTQLTDTPGENTQPDWSPDGASIVFESNRLGWPSLPSFTPDGYDPEDFGDEDVWVMRADGSAQRNLTRNPNESDSFPVWSPDGGWVMFTRHGTLFAVSREGDALAPVANSPGTDVFPDWIG